MNAVEILKSLFTWRHNGADVYRVMTYWGGRSWLTEKAPVTLDLALTAIRKPIGLWQCFGAVDSPCQYRDLVVVEFDVKECEGRGMQCVTSWALGQRDALRPLLSLGPVVWWNGNKSLYLIFKLAEPVPTDYVIREDVATYVKDVGADASLLTPRHALRVPGTPHPKTRHPGRFIDKNFRPVQLVEIKTVYPYSLLAKAEKKKVESKLGKQKGGVPRWVQRLIDYMCATGELCHHARVAVARSLLAAGKSVDDVVDVFRCAKDFNEKKTRYHVEYEAKRLAAGEKPWRCETVLRHCTANVPEGLCTT